MTNNAEIKRRAKKILGDTSQMKPPINVREIVRRHGIVLRELPHTNDDLSGAIMKSNGKSLIAVNALHSETRKRFTIAHELGHYFLHDRDVFVDRKSNFSTSVRFRKKQVKFDPKETEANAFAAELLMPSDLVKKHFMAIKNSLKKSLGELNQSHYKLIIQTLAEQFNVSPEAMGIRIEKLRKS